MKNSKIRFRANNPLLIMTLVNQGVAVAGALLTPLVTGVHLYLHMSLVIWLVFCNITGYTIYAVNVLHRRIWRKAHSETLRLITRILSLVLAVAIGLRLSSFVIGKLYLENVEAISSMNKLMMNSILVIVGMMVFFTWMYFRLKHELELRIAENEKLKRLELEQRMKLLQARVNPHFLFNTLNSIITLIYESPEKAEEVILKLSEMYRKIFSLPELHTLKEEIEFVESYLFIEKVRMGRRLRYEIKLPEELENIKIPPLLVEPLVENAVLHGIGPKREGGTVKVTCEDGGDLVRICVEDDGMGMTEYRAGFGIKSVEERLRLAFKSRARMVSIASREKGCVFMLEIPKEWKVR